MSDTHFAFLIGMAVGAIALTAVELGIIIYLDWKSCRDFEKEEKHFVGWEAK